jgi:hypothetical protein
MQNANYFGVMKCKIFSGPCLVPSKMQNLLPSLGPLEALFGIFWHLEAKIKMENSHLFAKNFAWCLVSLCKMMDQNPKFFGIKGELNTP